ncbi:hypothetical protein KC354_g12355 [Hortaea werneckii]|nr:hypothetical protein KC354_g12355 [Hortaea werneckii]
MAAPREELIQGAVTFLQDPSVASAPYEQKLNFLRSKNLTQDEIDASLARVGQAPSPSDQSSSYPPPQPQYRLQQQQQAYPQYGSPSQYPPSPYWQQHPPPPDLPRRDWRDWFIMATVVSGFGYACYWTAQRYILPLISPPTPPQLEQDKSAVDESFDKAFALLDQLASDTTELKESEKARTEKLDAALGEVEAVVGRMREANENREAEGRRLAREVEGLREGIPRAIEKERERDEERLRELVAEVRSLKTLVGNRMGGGSVGAGGAQQQQPQLGFRGNASQTATQQQQQPLTNGSAPAPVEAQNQPNGTSPAPATSTHHNNGVDASSSTTLASNPEQPTQTSSPFPDRAQASSSPFERGSGARGGAGKAAIPSWQLAAKKRSEEQQQQQSQKSSAEEGGGTGGGEVSGTAAATRVEDVRE